MAIVRWDPMRELEDLQRRLSGFFGSSMRNDPGFGEALARTEWYPAVDIAETPEAYSIQAELPDVKKEDIKVSVHEGVLMLAGERKQEREEKNKKYHRVERTFGRFERSFSLPTSVDDDKVTATFKDGVLSVLVPKAPQATPTAKEIKIG
jgi:HSP20 family protein